MVRDWRSVDQSANLLFVAVFPKWIQLGRGLRQRENEREGGAPRLGVATEKVKR
jgi:hypothetical protein